MSTIADLEAEVVGARKTIHEFGSIDDGNLSAFEAAVTKLVAQKYEAIIEERVQDTTKQRLQKPQPGDAVHNAWMDMKSLRDRIAPRLVRLLDDADDQADYDDGYEVLYSGVKDCLDSLGLQ